MANSYTFDQIATILNQIVADAQGRTADIGATPRDTSQFITMAQTALAIGTDPIMNSISQLINRSIFVARPYKSRFDILKWDNVTWGNAARKLTPIFNDAAADNPEYNNAPDDGASADQWTVKKPKTLQTNFIGAVQWQVQEPTVYVDQLNNAFRGPDELMQFLSMQRTAVLNEIEQQEEQLARMTVSTFIGSKIAVDNTNVIRLLTEYNAETGLQLDKKTVYQPGNFEAFIRWTSARMREIGMLMRERSKKFHQNLTGIDIMRHTPAEYQRCIIYGKALGQIDSMVRNSLFDDWLEFPNHTEISFWQNINQPDAISIKPIIMSESGTVSTLDQTITMPDIFAVLYDKDAMGYSIFNQGVNQTPINAKSRYYNTFHHFIMRYMLDMTENGVVFRID